MVETQKVTLEGALGETLAARLETPVGPPRAYALFAHCFSCSKDIHTASRIARGLAEKGIAVLRFDFTGLGQSEGDFANTNFSSNVEDLIKAAEYLRDTYEAPGLLVGHSLGGAAVIAAARRIEGVKAVATLGAPADAEHVKNNFVEHVDTIESEGEAEVSLGGRAFRIRKQFLEDIEGRTLDEEVGALNAALLIAHAPLDEVVGIDNATRLFVAAKHPKSFLSLDDADHLLSDPDHALSAARVIAAWAERYAAPDPLPDAPRPLKQRASAVVQETGLGGYHGWAVVGGGHSFTVDEPEDHGGLDGGASPYQILCAALGACTTMTLRMYAQRKGWDWGAITTEIVHEKVDGRDRFDRVVRIDGELTDEQADKLVEIAGKCPVHRTLERGSDVDTRAAVKTRV
mgnify:CR=1 FL=1